MATGNPLLVSLVSICVLPWWSAARWGAAQVDDAVAPYVDVLRQYESALLGKFARFEFRDLSNSDSYFDGIAIWTSEDGSIQRTEKTYGTRGVRSGQPYSWKVEECVYFFDRTLVRATLQNDETLNVDAFLETDANGLCFQLAAALSLLFGYNSDDCLKLSEIVTDEQSSITLRRDRVDNKAADLLDCANARLGRYEIWFVAPASDAAMRVHNVRITKTKGNEIRRPDRIERIEEETTLTEQFGPLEFENRDGAFVVSRIPEKLVWTSATGTGTYRSVAELEDLRPLGSRIKKRVEFDLVDIPSGQTVQVHGKEGLQFVLSNGRVVQVVDGSIVAAAGGTRYRRPKTAGRWLWYITLGMALVIVGFLLYRYRTVR